MFPLPFSIWGTTYILSPPYSGCKERNAFLLLLQLVINIKKSAIKISYNGGKILDEMAGNKMSSASGGLCPWTPCIYHQIDADVQDWPNLLSTKANRQ